MDSVTGRTVCSELFSLSSSFCICSVGFSGRQNLFRFNRCRKRGDRAPHLSCISAASRITRPLPRGFTGHVAVPNRSILSSRGEAEQCECPPRRINFSREAETAPRAEHEKNAH